MDVFHHVLEIYILLLRSISYCVYLKANNSFNVNMIMLLQYFTLYIK